jgi:hypothetical protein
MKNYLATTALLCLITTPVLAQSTAISGARSDASSQSTAGAVAIGGGNAQGGNARANANGNVGNVVNFQGNPANTTATIRNEGGIKNVPAVFAPGLAAAGIESCLGSVSGGGSWLGTGISFGGSIPDLDCSARLDARTLWAMGTVTKGPRGVQLRVAALRRLCQNDRIAAASPEICGDYVIQPQAPVPVRYPAPTVAPTRYASNPILLVDGVTGRQRMCNNYDEPGQKCLAWADAKQYKFAAKPQSRKQPATVAVTPPVAATVAAAPAVGFQP